MAFGRNKSLTAAVATLPNSVPPSRSLVSSALRFRFDDVSYNYWRFRDEAWQREAWRLYKITPELHFAASWVGQCCSRVRIYVANVDKFGRIQGEAKNRQVQALSDTLLGGPPSKAEHLRMMGIDLTVAGECYIIGRPDEVNGTRDKWYVVSPTEFRRIKGSNGEWDWAWGPKGNPMRLDLEKNIVTRVWTPDPERVWCADSPTRACQIVLRELEQLTKYVAAQIDSRLVGAGILIIPNDLDLPPEENTTNNAESLMVRLATAGAASLRGEGTALGVLPHIIEAANAEGFKLLSFDSELSKQAMELRQEAVERLGVGMDMPPEILSGSGDSNHWCLSIDTEIYTKDKGWIRQEELSIGDLALTLNHETGSSEWQPIQHIYTADVVDEPMLSMESASHSSLSTQEHRWPIVKTGRKVSGSRRRWATSRQAFAGGDRIPVAAPCATLPIEPKYTDDFVRLVAAYTSDGYLMTHRNNAIRIAKFKEHEIVELRRVITNVFGTTREYVHPTSTATGIAFWLDPTEAAALREVTGRHKAVNQDFVDSLTFAQLDLFLDSFIDLGDGCIIGRARTFFQVEPSRLDAIERAALLTGHAVRRGVRAKNYGFGNRPLHWISVSKSRVVFSPIDTIRKQVAHTGTVWCPTTANGSWLARRNGMIFYTGNSGYLVEGQGIKTHIEPLMTRICEALTEAYLVPVLRLMGEDPARYTFAFDTSPLVIRPQRLQDALNLYEKGVISAEALREEGYFKDVQKPSAEEEARRLLSEVLLRDPHLIQNQAIREAVGITEQIIPQSAMIAPTAQSISMAPSGSSGGAGPPPPMPPPTGIESELPPPIPDTLSKVGAPPRLPNPGGQPGPPPTGIQASAAQVQEMGVVMLAEATVRRGLELAGKRLLNGDNRHRWPDVPHLELHTRIRVQDQAHANRLLNGAWDQLPGMTQFFADGFDTVKLRRSLEKYCSILLLRGIAHDPPNLYSTLQADGVLHGQ